MVVVVDFIFYFDHFATTAASSIVVPMLLLLLCCHIAQVAVFTLPVASCKPAKSLMVSTLQQEVGGECHHWMLGKKHSHKKLN